MRKRVWDTVTFNGNLIVDQRFVYDGWNLIAMLRCAILHSPILRVGAGPERDDAGRGGVGGLLWGSDTASGAHFAGYDGNGNVVVLVSAADGTVTANYEYGPFGEPIRGKGAVVRKPIHSASRRSSWMKKTGWFITGIGITARRRGGGQAAIPLGRKALRETSISRSKQRTSKAWNRQILTKMTCHSGGQRAEGSR